MSPRARRRSLLTLIASTAFSTLSTGCRTVPAEKVAIIQGEIATVISIAKTPGPRTQAEVDRLEAKRVVMQRQVDEVSR